MSIVHIPMLFVIVHVPTAQSGAEKATERCELPPHVQLSRGPTRVGISRYYRRHGQGQPGPLSTSSRFPKTKRAISWLVQRVVEKVFGSGAVIPLDLRQRSNPRVSIERPESLDMCKKYEILKSGQTSCVRYPIDPASPLPNYTARGIPPPPPLPIISTGFPTFIRTGEYGFGRNGLRKVDPGAAVFTR